MVFCILSCGLVRFKWISSGSIFCVDLDVLLEKEDPTAILGFLDIF